jgi:fibronectin-binding autotransporter adhesin
MVDSMLVPPRSPRDKPALSPFFRSPLNESRPTMIAPLIRRRLLLCALAPAIVPMLSAQTLFWDGNDGTGDADGGTGTWDTGTTANWDAAASGGASVVWPALSSGTDAAVFGGTAGTVTIDAAGVAANSLAFATAGYTLSGGSLTLDGTTPSITNNGAATINANLLGSAGLNKVGNGTLALGGNNTGLAGALVLSGATSGNNGGITANGANSIAGFTSIDIQNNSFLQLNGLTIGSGVPVSVAGGGGTSAPQGALRGLSGVNVINAAVTLANNSVRLGNLGTSTTFNGAITAAGGSGFGILIRNSNNQGTIFTNTSNHWEGSTVLGEGSMYFHADSLPAATNLSVAGSGNTWFESHGSFTRAIGAAAGQLQFNATAGRVNGFSARGGNLAVDLGGASAPLTWGSGGFAPAILGLAGANATHTLTWLNPLNLNGASRTIDLANGLADVDAEMTGAISGGSGSILSKTGSGTLLLSVANTHAGGSVIAGIQGSPNPLRISHSNALGTGNLTIGSGGNNDQSRLELTGGITVANGVAAMASRNNSSPSILNLSGNNTMSANLSSGGGGARITFQSDSGRLTLSGSVAVRNPVFTGAGDFLLSGNIGSPSGYRTLTKEGAGTLVLSGGGNVTETTTITAGTLQIGDGGTSGALGTGTVTNNATLVFKRSDSLTVGNSIGGSGAVVQQGTGTVTLTGASLSWSGGTTVAAGVLVVGADLSGGGVLSVESGATLAGGFGIAAPTTVAGTHAPGTSPGEQTFSAGLSYATGSFLDWDFAGNALATAGSDYDRVNVTGGDLDIDAAATLRLVAAGVDYLDPAWDADRSFTVIAFSGGGTSSGWFQLDTSLAGVFAGEGAWSVANQGGSVVVTWAAIPEPCAAMLVVFAALPLARRRR